MIAPLPASRRGDGDGGAFEGPADEPCVATGAPLAEQDTAAFGQSSQEAAPEKPRMAVEVGLGALPPVSALQMPEAGERHLQPEHAEQGDGRSRHDEHDQPQTVQRPEPGHDGAERGRALKRPHGAGPERGGGHRERPAVEPEAQPQRGVLAVGHHVGRERRRHGKAETGGGDIHGPISGDRPRRPGAAGREQEGAEPRSHDSHGQFLPSVHGMHCGHGQLPAPPRRLRAPMRTAPMREMPATAAPPVRSLPSSPAPARPPIQSRTAEGSRSISLKEAFISP